MKFIAGLLTMIKWLKSLIRWLNEPIPKHYKITYHDNGVHLYAPRIELIPEELFKTPEFKRQLLALKKLKQLKDLK